MKTRLLLMIFSLVLLSATASAQNQRIGAHEAITGWTATRTNTLSNDDVKQVIADILNAVGAKANFIVQPANIQNAAAVTYGNKRYILYNPRFMTTLTQATGTKWAPISVLAHEVGHHINGHKAAASQQQLELQADEFSGYVLRKMGASVHEAQAAMSTLGNVRATRSHPAQTDRLLAIEDGWLKADEAITGNTTARRSTTTSTSNPVYSSPSATNSTAGRSVAINSSAILGQVIFNAAPSARIYITKNLRLVQLKENTVSTIGKIAALNSRQYPYVIYDSNNTQLLVDNRGNVLTKSGKQVGALKAFN